MARPKQYSQPFNHTIANSRLPPGPATNPLPINVMHLTAAPALSATDHVNESQIKVPLQRSYPGPKPVIRASLANTHCDELEVHGLLNRLNSTLGTSYTQDTPGVSSLLEHCVSNKYDFGTAYARLRLKWCNGLTTIKDELRKSQARDLKIRNNALVDNRILDSRIPPRRVWDLYSNRVVPHWYLTEDKLPWAISHAWLDYAHLIHVRTRINGGEWPVPIPSDVNLDLIRIELLNLGAEYVWLDVLCLRQRSNGPGEDRTVVCYLSGLGRPLDFKEACDLGSDRCWFRRAWTLQETNRHYKIAGIPASDSGDLEDVEQMLHKQMTSLKIIRNPRKTIFDVLVYMQSRVSTNPADKVAGLAYLLYSKSLPAYNGTQSVEDAWTALVDSMPGEYRGDLFLLYPKPGDGINIWRPSWNQVMNDKLPLLDRDRRDEDVVWDKEKEAYRCSRAVRCIGRGYIRGLSVGDPQKQPRPGKLEVKDAYMMTHIFEIVAVHQHPIPDGSYTLLGGKRYWVIGRRLRDGKFRKVSVFTVADKRERERLKRFGGAREVLQYLA
ncbi:hypothetical protein ARMSODRAFT_1010845 [Armillaria solidipes]|uniref:Heterokaryon incompatibility domain-containing protein n=1 Tax=Armillaria solidipes TaxID=1076256 RepID=A0A2H3CSH0_9AGAR|nr:hypothetical protein ARMSODRAFT_1010845 [Armillaria solidipes]